jgi:hypothetical protein
LGFVPSEAEFANRLDARRPSRLTRKRAAAEMKIEAFVSVQKADNRGRPDRKASDHDPKKFVRVSPSDNRAINQMFQPRMKRSIAQCGIGTKTSDVSAQDTNYPGEFPKV